MQYYYQHNAQKLARALRQYKIDKPKWIDKDQAKNLPEAYRKFWFEWNSEPSPVHFVKDDRTWYRDEETGQVKRFSNWPIFGLRPREADQGLWGNETIVKGFQKRQELRKRVPHFWVPTLVETIFYSEILNKHMSTIATKRARVLVIENFGLDHYLLKTPANDLRSKLAVLLKRKMLIALRDKTLYPDDPEKQAEVYNKYKHYLDAYTHEEIEWYGLSPFEALKKYDELQRVANAPKPLKLLYRQELLEELKNPPSADAVSETGTPSTWIKKLNPFASKET